MTSYFHGGRPGMRPGQFVLPPSITGAKSMADFGAEGICRRDHVYVTTEFQAAALYGGMYRSKKGGDVYLVEPIGELESDPDCDMPGLSYSVPKARIIKVLRLSPSEVRMVREAMLS